MSSPAEYRLQPSALSAWRVTRETAALIAGWCQGTWEAGDPIVVRIPTPYGLIAAPEGWTVVRYGTSATGAGLFWAVPGELFESACASADGANLPDGER